MPKLYACVLCGAVEAREPDYPCEDCIASELSAAYDGFDETKDQQDR